MSKKIYIAGKVTGEDRQACIDKFANAKELVEVLGFEAVNPLEVVGDWDADWREAMKKCIAALVGCDGVLLLDDWKFSKGATIERQLADDLDITICNNTPFGLQVLKNNLQ